MKHTILLSLIMILLVSLCSCQMDMNLDEEIQYDHEGSCSWMSQLPDASLLRDMTIPGTHDTCANYDLMGLSSTAAAQDLTLSEQLKAGVRYVDIRPCLEGDKLIIRHGITKQHIDFSEVLTVLENFLSDNPSETVVLAILPEYTDKDNYENVSSYLRSLDSSPFVFGEDLSSMTLGQVRGKILVIRRSSAPASMDDIFCSGYTETGAAYKTTDLDGQWNRIQTALETPSWTNVTAVYTAGYYEGQFGIPNIRIASSNINPRLKQYLIDNRGTKSFGIIVTDHITKNLAHAIYMCNL